MKEALSPAFLKVPKPALKLRQGRIIKTHAEYTFIKVKNTFTGPSFRSEIRKRQPLPDE